MNMYNDNFNEMETFDIEEFMHMEALIKERDAYEEEFFSMEPPHDEQYFWQGELYLELQSLKLTSFLMKLKMMSTIPLRWRITSMS